MLAKNNEYLEETAESLYKANADEIVRQQCRAREDAERRERTLERDNKRLKEELETAREGETKGLFGMVDFCKEFELTFEETVIKIAEKYKIDSKEIRGRIEEYWNK